ncbi:MAG: molybdopterin biosynthesis protein [Clostridia bacterium]|nr:molybdopterin biosynthesis protein [Clostridia bacterium]
MEVSAAKRSVYLSEVPLDEAVRKFFDALEEQGAAAALPGESIAVDIAALGRITAQPVFARISSPHYHACAMDGVAVKSASTFAASERRPVTLSLGENAIMVDTGDPLPFGFDAVIMIEDLVETTDHTVTIIAPAKPWQNVRSVGEDIVATELVLPENHAIRAADVGAMLASGVTHVEVRRRPKVVIIPTGDELVAPGSRLQIGDIVEFNSRIIGGLVSEWGGEPVFNEIVHDEFDEITKAVQQASAHGDIVIVNAGSSAGSEDYTSAVVERLGEVIVHGVAIKPGKPTILGTVDGRPFIGVPGYPVSASLACELFLRPLMARLLARPEQPLPRVNATATRRILSTPGVEEFVRVKVGDVGGKLVVTPLARGAGAIMSLVKADGIVRVPPSAQGIDEGATVQVELLRSLDEIRRTVVAIGSHDLALDILSTFLARAYPGMSLSSAHVGSMGGLMAMRRGEAHIAGTHLIDEETGDYNVPYVKRMLDAENYALVNLVHREQGFIVPGGNPKNITGFGDIARADVVFVNRQRGAGTRVLLDMELGKLGIDPGAVKGYSHEEYTHMGVAASVANGAAYVGLGIHSAASALGLDFIPVSTERYDLLTTREFLESEMMNALLAVVRSDEFKQTVLGLGGYDVSDTGKVVWQGWAS